MEREIVDLLQWCVDESKEVSLDATVRYNIQLNAAEQSQIAQAIYIAIGSAFRRIGQEPRAN